MARLLSVNVGLPRDIGWKGRTVRTGIWKTPVTGRCRARRMNLEGDGQGDLAGHGGEQRALLVYQLDSYRHWEAQLTRAPLAYGQFGENLTVEGLPDSEVCIGDRYRIGDALFEVTQPRVTCYRVGIRLEEPRMPALMTGSGRPGFYLRVLEEGSVGAGDEIRKVGAAPVQMTVVDINALLYSHAHAPDALERALRIGALSPGWRSSFEALRQSAGAEAGSGNAGLMPQASARPAAPGFWPMTVTAIEPEAVDVISLRLQAPAEAPRAAALPGQYIVLRLAPSGSPHPVLRSYSLSDAAAGQGYRISVKVEAGGVGGTFVRDHVRVGDAIEASLPRGNFVLATGENPVVLISAGIGITPVLAMLHALAEDNSGRHVIWLHAARDGDHDAFAAEVRGLLQRLRHVHSRTWYSAPGSRDAIGVDFDAAGRLSLQDIDIPNAAEAYLCGPPSFMSEVGDALVARGLPAPRIHTERFNGGESQMPGVIDLHRRAPHAPVDDEKGGAVVTFARSGVSAHWRPSRYASILELAEACDVAVRWSCRSGVCHSCESGLISGRVVMEPQPLDEPARGNVLVCCAQPDGDVVVEL